MFARAPCAAHEVRPVHPAGSDVGRKPVGGIDVVAQHLLALAERIHPDAWHVPLHECHRDRPPLPRGDRQQGTRHGYGDSQQDQRDGPAP